MVFYCRHRCHSSRISCKNFHIKGKKRGLRELFTNGIQIEVKEGIQVRVEKKDSLSSSWVATSIECSFVLSLVSRNLSFAVAVVELACLWIQSKTNFSLPFAQARSSLLGWPGVYGPRLCFKKNWTVLPFFISYFQIEGRDRFWVQVSIDFE